LIALHARQADCARNIAFSGHNIAYEGGCRTFGSRIRANEALCEQLLIPIGQ